jgi:hypothetical protein
MVLSYDEILSALFMGAWSLESCSALLDVVGVAREEPPNF